MNAGCDELVDDDDVVEEEAEDVLEVLDDTEDIDADRVGSCGGGVKVGVSIFYDSSGEAGCRREGGDGVDLEYPLKHGRYSRCNVFK